MCIYVMKQRPRDDSRALLRERGLFVGENYYRSVALRDTSVDNAPRSHEECKIHFSLFRLASRARSGGGSAGELCNPISMCRGRKRDGEDTSRHKFAFANASLPRRESLCSAPSELKLRILNC